MLTVVVFLLGYKLRILPSTAAATSPTAPNAVSETGPFQRLWFCGRSNHTGSIRPREKMLEDASLIQHVQGRVAVVTLYKPGASSLSSLHFSASVNCIPALSKNIGYTYCLYFHSHRRSHHYWQRHFGHSYREFYST
jgi:hypothetical protein